MEEERPKKFVTAKQAGIGVSALLAGVLSADPLMDIFMKKDMAQIEIANVQAKIASVEKNILDRFDRQDKDLRERDAAMESRHIREMDNLMNRVETLEAARMGVQLKTKTN